MASFTADLTGLEKERQRFERMVDRAKNLNGPLRAAADDLRGVILESFESGSSPLGGSWEPLDADTKGSSRPLAGLGSAVRTGSDGKSITFGLAGPKAVAASVAQFGAARSGRKGRSRIPARPFMPIAPNGEPSFASGRAKAWMNRVRAATVDWILNGK